MGNACGGLCLDRRTLEFDRHTQQLVLLSYSQGFSMIRRFFTFCLVMICVVYAGFLVWQEQDFRKSQASPSQGAAPLQTPSPRASLDATAIASVFGLRPEASLLPSAEPLTLLASFVVISGLSKALLADAQGARIYQVGDRLPGGSILRRVETDKAVLWNKGREEVLMLQTSTVRFLNRLDHPSAAPAPATPTRYLRPYTE